MVLFTQFSGPQKWGPFLFYEISQIFFYISTVCLSRIIVKRKFSTNNDGTVNEYDILAKCGKCPRCLAQKSEQWAFRIFQQCKDCTSRYFVTLTYQNSQLPSSRNGYASLKTGHVRDFIKRLRYYDDNDQLKFFACGEYGSNFYRPHYHICLFNLKALNSIGEAWQNPHSEHDNVYGYVHIGELNAKSAAYCAKYMCKMKKVPYFATDDRTPEFHRMSKGLGENFLTDEMVRYYQSNPFNLSVKFNNRRIPLPNYYRKKIWTDPQVLEDQILYVKADIEKRRAKKAQEIKRLYKGKLSFKEYEERHKLHLWNNLLTKTRSYEKF